MLSFLGQLSRTRTLLKMTLFGAPLERVYGFSPDAWTSLVKESKDPIKLTKMMQNALEGILLGTDVIVHSRKDPREDSRKDLNKSQIIQDFDFVFPPKLLGQIVQAQVNQSPAESVDTMGRLSVDDVPSEVSLEDLCLEDKSVQGLCMQDLTVQEWLPISFQKTLFFEHLDKITCYFSDLELSSFQ